MICENCGMEFEGRSDKLFCSKKCGLENFRKVETNRTETVLTVSKNTEVGLSPLGEVDLKLKPIVPNPSYMNIEKDLKLSPEKDLGILGWTPDGIFVRDDITITQARRIRSLVEAKHNWPHRTYEDSGIKMVGNV